MVVVDFIFLDYDGGAFTSMTNLNTFRSLCDNLNRHNSLHIPSPPYQKRRAAVAAIVRWRPHHHDTKSHSNKITSLEEFFQQPWVNGQGEAEILFMQRATRDGDRWSGHVSFVGGKNEPGETDEETVKREVLEEIGIDLNSDDYIQIGKLNEREITSVKDNKLLMILIPFVYLQVVPESPEFKLQESEVAAVQWVPLSFFLSTDPYPYRRITEQLNLVKLKRSSWATPLVRLMMGSVTFPAIDLPTSPEVKTLFRLWGLTLGMTREIIEFTQLDHNRLAFLQLAKSKPIFSRPDIGWLTTLIASITFTIKNKTAAVHKSSDKEMWDKVYFNSIRKGIMVAVLVRLGFAALVTRFIIKKLL